MSEIDAISQRKAKLLAELEAVEKEEAEALAKEKPAAIERIIADIKKFSITARELGLTQNAATRLKSGTKREKSVETPGTVNPPKYRNPETGQEWTGHGKAPKWIGGKDRDQFLISKEGQG